MQTIDIQINKARISRFAVQFREDNTIPDVVVEIDLLAGHRQVSSFTLQTNHWSKAQKFDVPTGILEPIIAISRELEQIVTSICRERMMELADLSQEAPHD